MAFAEDDAKSRGMTAVFLDAQQAAIGFYQTLGFAMHTAPSMRKGL
jgi:hypothetical protein